MRRKKLVKLRIDEVSTVSVGSGHECRMVLMKRQDDKHKNGLSQMEQMRKVVTDEEREFLSSWVNSMSPDLRRWLRELVDEAERQERSTLVTGSTPGADVHGNSGQGELSAAERRGYGSGRQKRDSLRKIADDFGLMPLCKHIEATGSHGFDENEFATAVEDYAAKKGVPVSKLWAGDSEESRAICKAASICRYETYARQAQANIVDASERASTG